MHDAYDAVLNYSTYLQVYMETVDESFYWSSFFKAIELSVSLWKCCEFLLFTYSNHVRGHQLSLSLNTRLS